MIGRWHRHRRAVEALAVSQRDLDDLRACRDHLLDAGLWTMRMTNLVLIEIAEAAAELRAELDARAESMGFALPPIERTRAVLMEAA